MRISFKRYLGKPAHVMVCVPYTMPPETSMSVYELVRGWSLLSKRSRRVVLRRKDVPVAAAVLRLQGYEVEIES